MTGAKAAHKQSPPLYWIAVEVWTTAQCPRALGHYVLNSPDRITSRQSSGSEHWNYYTLLCICTLQLQYDSREGWTGRAVQSVDFRCVQAEEARGGESADAVVRRPSAKRRSKASADEGSGKGREVKSWTRRWVQGRLISKVSGMIPGWRFIAS